MKSKLVQLLRQREFDLFLFCLLFLLLNWPFLGIATGGGLGGLFFYLFVLWSIVVFVQFLAWAIRRRGSSERDSAGDG